MNEKMRNVSIKLLLTIPALIMGILSALMLILKPLKELWFPTQQPKVVEITRTIIEEQQDHDFH